MSTTTNTYLAIAAIILAGFTSFVTWWIAKEEVQMRRIDTLTERVHQLEKDCYRRRENLNGGQ